MGVETGHLKESIPNASIAVRVRQRIHSFNHHATKFVPLKTHITLKKICSPKTHLTGSLHFSQESSTSTFSQKAMHVNMQTTVLTDRNWPNLNLQYNIPVLV
jgi:hypothetical protein